MIDILQRELSKINVPYEVTASGEYLFKQTPLIVPRINHYYIVQLANYILHPYEGFTLHSNYNNNVIPECEFMEIELVLTMGKLYKISGVGYDFEKGVELLDKTWEGFVPQKSISFLSEVF